MTSLALIWQERYENQTVSNRVTIQKIIRRYKARKSAFVKTTQDCNVAIEEAKFMTYQARIDVEHFRAQAEESRIMFKLVLSRVLVHLISPGPPGLSYQSLLNALSTFVWRRVIASSSRELAISEIDRNLASIAVQSRPNSQDQLPDHQHDVHSLYELRGDYILHLLSKLEAPKRPKFSIDAEIDDLSLECEKLQLEVGPDSAQYLKKKKLLEDVIMLLQSRDPAKPVIQKSPPPNFNQRKPPKGSKARRL